MPREIPLSKGNVALVDDEDYERLSKITWCIATTGYAKTNMRKEGIYRTVFMHRYILDAPQGLVVDHIDGNKLNNQRANLRLCTHSQNCMNKSKNHNNKSGYKGVCWDKWCQRWKAGIEYRGVSITIGNYKCKHEAARDYNAKARELFGEFARLNEIPESDAV